MDLQEPERKMSTTGGTEAGTVYVLDEPDAIRKKLGSAVTDSGREVVRGEDKPGITNLIDILAVARGIDPAEVEREFEGAGYGDFKKAVAEAVVEFLAPVRERYAELRPDEAALEAILAAGAEKARAIAAPTLAEVRERMGFGPPGAIRALRCRMTVAELDLDLDVFAGPFDLLLAVVLREEVDLLEVELGEVVVAYVEHLEREGELELEVATEFLVLIASLLELKSRLLLPGADDGLEELGPEEAVEELLARLLEYRRYRDAAADAGRALRGRARLPLPLGAAAAGAAPGRRRRGDRRLRPRAARRRARRPADARRRARPRPHPPDRLAGEAAARPARRRSPASASIDFDEQFGGEDRLTQAVTLFALLELYRKGEATWKQSKPLGPIEIVEGRRPGA